jgi:hypothetical protein
MPVVGEKDAGRQIERVQRAGTVESAGQQPEVRKDADPPLTMAGGPRYLLWRESDFALVINAEVSRPEHVKIVKK